ncbi:MAG: dihydroorotase [Pseudomonadota bacterium]
MRQAFLNARLLDPASGLDQTGGLIADGNRIAEFGPDITGDGLADDILMINCHGHCLAPGLVDSRVRLGEPGEAHKETIASASAAAAAGGVTTMACLPDGPEPIDSMTGLEFIARRAREIKQTKIFAYACVTRQAKGKELAEMGLLAEAGAVGFTDGARAVADALVLNRALAYAGALGKPIIQHPEEPRLAMDGVMNAGELSTRLGLAGIPRQAEVMMIERDLRLVELTGAAYHVAHVSTAESVAAIRHAKKSGLPVTCDTAPTYFALTETDVGEYRTFAKLSPPLRSDEDRRAIVEGLADGTIDIIASDHWPQDVESKRLPFAQAEPGVVGLETLLQLALELAHKDQVSLLQILAAMTHKPAELIDQDLGRLTKGAPADLVLFELDRPGRIDVESFRSKSKNSPFDRRPTNGTVLATVVDGRTVYRADNFPD